MHLSFLRLRRLRKTTQISIRLVSDTVKTRTQYLANKSTERYCAVKTDKESLQNSFNFASTYVAVALKVLKITSPIHH